MLSDDSAVRASAMHEAVSDGEGTIANSLPIDRNTREYGSPDEAAAALVDEVVSGSQEAKPVKPVVEPARPSKEVDWGVWSTGQSNCEGAAVPGLAFLPGGAPMKPEDSARFDVAPGPSPLPLLVAEPITAATEPVAILPPQPVALLRPPALPTVTGASTRVPPAEARAGARSPSNVVSRIDINADSKLDPPAHLANSRRMWLWTLGAFAAGLLGFVAVSRRGPEPAAATPPGTATSVGAAPSAPRDPAAPSAQQLHTPLAPKPSHGDPPTPATDRPALRSKPPSQPQSGVVTAVPNLPAVADLHRRCVAADDDGKGKAKVVANVCRPALDADPKDVDVMVILARAELDRGRLAEARTLAKRALGVDAQRVDAYIYLGNVEQEAGKVDDARAAYKKYLELAPNGPFARELRAILSNL
jgi:hypothetical protein